MLTNMDKISQCAWHAPRWRINIPAFLLVILFISLMSEVTHAWNIIPMTSDTFVFTQSSYNASINEGAVGKSYVTPAVKMGMYVTDPKFNVRYKVVSGDEDGLFKADERLIGDFCFLRLRLRTGSHSVINRELRDSYKLTIKARGDYGHNSKTFSTQAEVIVKVLDENDLSPIFFERSYAKQIPENTPLHASILRVEASDADIGVNGEIYFSFAAKTEVFAIHPTNGIIYLTRPLSYSDDEVFELEVLAKDRGPATWGYNRPSRASLRVEVVKVNFHAPKIQLQELPSVIEHGSVNSVYAILYVSDEDVGPNGGISSVRIVDGDPNGYFKLSRGDKDWEYNIEVAHNLDRELDPYGFNLTIQAADNGSQQRVTTQVIHVKLQDTNDQTPEFDQEEYFVTVDECVPTHTPLMFLTAKDDDYAKNAEIQYGITTGNEFGWFIVDSLSGLLSVNKLLDAENKSSVELTVTAEDQANMGSRRISSTRVNVTIRDCNDNAPIFMLKEPVEVIIDEALPIGSSVYVVRAFDLDQGENGYISYSIANSDDVPFDIDHFSGNIITKEVLDYERMQRTYHLQVRASDWGNPFRREAEMVITIKLADINDNKPQFEKVDCKGYLSRDAPVGTSLIVIPAIDFEVANIISYMIVSGNDDNCFEIIPSNGELRTNCRFQPSSQDVYSLRVSATDGVNSADPTFVNVTLVNSRNKLITTGYASITCQETQVSQELTALLSQAAGNNMNINHPVTNDSPFMRNSHTPRFPVTLPTSVIVSEGRKVGDVILSLAAEDDDQGYNGKLVYSIFSGNIGDVFRMDTFTGDLVIMSKVDREATEHFHLNITVSDMGLPPKSAFKILDITIEDVNDNSPVFEKPEYSIKIREDHPVNGSVLYVHATDADASHNGEVTYSIITDSVPFNINSVTGEITVKQFLDRETKPEHVLKVRAMDRANVNRLTTDVKVTVKLDDVNDNSPKFQQSSYHVRAREDLPVGTVVVTIQAEDPDDDKGGEVRYSLLDGMDEKFEIDRITGTIRIAQELDFESKQIYNITARAKDRGDVSLSTRCEIIIEVVDVNENLFPPDFADFVFQGRVKENEPVNTIVMQLIAMDDDAKKNPLATPKDYDIVYSIRNGSGLGLFTIDRKGNIRTTEVLDRETQSHYWVTIYAQDRGTVPLTSMVEVLIEVEDVNDNVPQTIEPVYYPGVMENSLEGTSVVKLEAFDQDESRNNRVTYSISSGNPQGFFAIDHLTGLITTTQRQLDRETQEEHVLEVNCSDNGFPKLSSITRVVITVGDDNDNEPQFTDYMNRVRIPEMPSSSYEMPLYRVLAYDLDKGANAELTFHVEDEEGLGRFTIHPKTGQIMSRKEFFTGQQFHVTVIAKDNGNPQHESSAQVRFKVVEKPPLTTTPPFFTTLGETAKVMENDVVGHLVTLISAEDPDGDKLWYSIIGGNSNDVFSIDPEAGNILVAGQLDWETQSQYNLTVQVSDAVHLIHTWVLIEVLDINDNRPEFDQARYKVEIPENTAIFTDILTVTATDKDEDQRLFYTIHSAVEQSSLSKFRINSETDKDGAWSGVITTMESLDREVMTHHELTIMVRDQGYPSKRSFARVLITIQDHNDHSPHFLSSSFEGRVFETATIGTAVIQVLAGDRDTGTNAEIKYSIVNGNLGGAFIIDSTLGIISVATDLDKIGQSEYNLMIKATDGGSPSLSSTASVKIIVTTSDNAPPKFTKSEYTAQVDENSEPGTHVIIILAKSRSSVTYDIISGDAEGYFTIVPSSGVIYNTFPVDHEKIDFFNLTVRGTNMAGATSVTTVLVHVIDLNDNYPVFLNDSYSGSIGEEASPGNVVLSLNNTPLVVKAMDNDSGHNAQLVYEIIEDDAKLVFDIDSSTGAIKTKVKLDREATADYAFTVQVMDMGQPQLSADVPAKVNIHILDINDSPPQFPQSTYVTTLLLSNFHNMALPVYKNVEVINLTAIDPDLPENSALTYEIVNGNEQLHFAVDSQTGVVRVDTVGNMLDNYDLTVRVSDGKYQSQALLHINVDFTPDDGLSFSREDYYAEIYENSTGTQQVSVVQATGHHINEHLTFSILNPNDMFQIGATSGVIQTTGKLFDREHRDNYTLTIAVHDEQKPPRIAHSVLHINIMDVNDNKPIFVNQPYYAIVSLEAQIGEVVKKVSAIDRDIGSNGQLLYTLLDDGDDKFGIEETTGRIYVNKKLSFSDQNREYKLIVQASDKGDVPQKNTAEVPLTIRNEATPIFAELYYSVSVPESIPVHSAILSIEAKSPKGRKLIYSISDGDIYNEFSVQFETDMDVLGPCSILVQEELDYEFAKSYELTLTATDFQTGAFSHTIVHIDVEDVNDNAPSFQSVSYITTVSEAVAVGTSILTVTAKDDDAGHNAKIHYHLEGAQKSSSDHVYFHIDPEKGDILTKIKLDREVAPTIMFSVVATDSGYPALSSSVTVTVVVTDLNDNPPKFEQPSYDVMVTDLAQRGQFVTKVIAADPDSADADQLRYSIVGGNPQQTFSIDDRSGVISLSSLRKPEFLPAYTLNISVTDGVFTNFARVLIKVEFSNNHVPTFSQSLYEVGVVENMPPGTFVTRISAVDLDIGKYGTISYSIESEDAEELFRIEEETGKLYTNQAFDREKAAMYQIPVVAVDGGGRSGYTLVRVSVADQADHKPQFVMSEYKANIYAGTEVGASVLQVQALDNDLAFNADLEYSIYGHESTQAAEYFEVVMETGVIRLTKSVKGHENELFQFFIRAQDHGITPQYSDVPVDIYVIGPEDYPPRFPSEHMEFFVNEDKASGSIVATVPAESNQTLVYSIVPGEMPYTNNPAKFTIDNSAKITILEPLDRETTKRFDLTIKAETETSPPLVAFTKVSFVIRDVNDNSPQFESNPYTVSIVENVNIGSQVVQVIAHDKDIGANADISYEFQDQQYAGVFTINKETGWITTLIGLDRETVERYTFGILAKDRGNEIQFTSSTTVIVQVMDHNDEAPRFTEDRYGASVNEDALPGTIIRMVTSVDRDLPPNNRVTYSIIGGDLLGQFNIRETGEIYVNKELDREKASAYDLIIAATDGAFVTTATVSMEILDANDNTPICSQRVYQVSISESKPPGYIIQVMATDADEAGTPNARISYTITGDPDNIFFIQDRTGILTSIRSLDRETTPRYHLEVRASDGGGRYCTCDVYITVTDENDNAPKFSSNVYTVQVSEDAEVNSLLVRVSATDIDSGIHRKVQYALSDGETRFKIDRHSGIISLNAPLDREKQARYDFPVYAYDMGTPRMSTAANITVLVLDVNDNPPEFEHIVYSATVSESLPIGGSICVVYATSKDTGINAEITYSITGGNEQGNFQIDPELGFVTVSKALDYESLRDYVLMIEARDGGHPPLSNMAMVKINVTDANDNAPIFSQEVYQATLREDIAVNSLVIELQATDLDSAVFSKMTYGIASGDRYRQFDINPETGLLFIAAPLDRESIAMYDLIIQAVDSGSPAITGTTTVSIEILDINDTPPRFTETNYTVVMQVNEEGQPRMFPGENAELGYNLMKIEVTDDDLDPNGPPFTFDIVSGNEQNKFHLDRAGILSTAATFNRHIKDMYDLTVRVFDNGIPPLYSDIVVNVQLVEESAFPPMIQPMSVSVITFSDEFPGGFLGQVKAHDPDPYDEIAFSLSSDNGFLFEIDEKDGMLKALQSLDAGRYNITVSVSDGKFITNSHVMVNVNNIDTDMAENAAVVRFDAMSAEDFINTHRESFMLSVASELSVRQDYVHILSIQPASGTVMSAARRKRSADSDLDVLVAVQRSDSKFYNSKKLLKNLKKAEEDLERAMNVQIVQIENDICLKDTCTNGECVTIIEFYEEELITVETSMGSYVFPQHGMSTQCNCMPGFTGAECKTATVCHDNLCPAPFICVSEGTSYECRCPDGTYGENCELIRPTPCTGMNCGDDTTSFKGQSYVSWTLTVPMERRLDLSLEIRTESSHARLMHAHGLVDYAFLEISEGRVQYRFDCGSGEGLARVDGLKVNDGKWHWISVQRVGGKVNIVIDDKFHSNEGRVPGTNDVLNLNSNEVYFGAEVDKSPNGYETVTKGFVGCMRNIQIDTEQLRIAGGMSVAVLKDMKDIEFGCEMFGICAGSPCLNGGKCIALSESSYMCHCSSQRFKGPNCEHDFKPCASSPCLNGGQCQDHAPNGYRCYCISPNKGKNCELNCDPNPCKHGASCTSSANGPICQCKPGYTGVDCGQDIDECQEYPCKNNGRCQNTYGGFLCNCTAGISGMLCENASFPPIKSSKLGINQDEILIISAVLIGVIVIVAIFVLIIFCRRRKKRSRLRENGYHPAPDRECIDNFHCKVKNIDDAQQTNNIPMMNLNHRHSPPPPPVPKRPASYTASTADSMNTLARCNLDSFKDYGSAADELENMASIREPIQIPDFLTNVDAEKTSNPRRYLSEEEPLLKRNINPDNLNFAENYPNDLKKQHKFIPSESNSRQTTPQLRSHGCSIQNMGVSEDDLAGYHWDTSDWNPEARPQISEVPIKEVFDDSPRSSQHSNDSNLHVDQGDYEYATDYPDEFVENDGNESEYVGDTDYNELDGAETDDPDADYPEPPNFQEILQLQGQLRFDDDIGPAAGNPRYDMHPNHYLPQYNISENNSQIGDDDDDDDDDDDYNGNFTADNFARDDDDDVIYYGFPRADAQKQLVPEDLAGNRLMMDFDNAGPSIRDDMTVSMDGYTSTNASCSDISAYGLCDIEDSEPNNSDNDEDDQHLAKLLKKATASGSDKHTNV